MTNTDAHLKPLIKWNGGKSDELKHIIPHIPEYETYVEPFFGGGSLFFYLNRYQKKNVINDIHPDLISLYQSIKYGYGDIIYSLMAKYPNDETTYYHIRDQFPVTNLIEQAFKFFYLRKTCYRGMLRYNKQGKFNIPYGRYKTYNYEILKDARYHQLLSNTDIYHSDFTELFNKYGQDEKSFFFLDPPYDGAVFSNYGFCLFNEEKQIVLADEFKKAKCKCLLVISETDLIQKLYSGYIVEKYEVKYRFKITKNRVNNGATHLMIKNY